MIDACSPRVILDVDTGVDDALAIALAVGDPRVQLEAVIAVAGNVGWSCTTRNSLRVLDWLGATGVPVYAGADAPVSGPLREASHWHAEDGLGGARLPESSRLPEPDGVGYLCARLLAEPGASTLVCTGPLTNLALALQREPRIVDCVRKIVVMGGAARVPGQRHTCGGIQHVCRSRGRRVCLRAALADHDGWPGRDRAGALHARGPGAHSASEAATGVLVRELCRHLFDNRRVESMALHDPLALAIAVRAGPGARRRRAMYASRRVASITLGQTVVDWRVIAPPPARATRVCTSVDAERARTYFFASLGLPLA